ncbi:MAG: DUF4430 domain-containing protein [Eggerthellaceae bacterium]|nr:DUF4430 domain-containing protein [Eggerthellaceae bacterium]
MKDAHKRFFPKHVFGLVALVALALAACLALASCTGDSGSGAAGDNAASTGGYVQMNIDTSSLDGGVVEIFNVDAPSGATVLDVLNLIGVQYSSENGDNGVVVTSIKGISQGDAGPASCWHLCIGITYTSDSPDSITVKDGDLITWVYSVDGNYADINSVSSAAGSAEEPSGDATTGAGTGTTAG